MRKIWIAAAIMLAACQGETPANSQTGDGQSGRVPLAATGEAAPADLLTLAEGAVVVSASFDPTAALSLTDGNPETSWSTPITRNPLPYTFVFELRAPTVLSKVGAAGAGPRPGGVAGGSAKDIVVEASSEGPDGGFAEVARFAAADTGETLVDAKSAGAVRWLRFTVTSTHGSDKFAYFAEAIAQGTQEPANSSFSGTFRTARADHIQLKQDGTLLTGCYTEQSGNTRGTLSGDVVNGVARLAWRNSRDITGTALFVIDSKGALNGVGYRQRSRYVWGGPPAEGDAAVPCADELAPSNPVAAALEEDGKAIIYGILFDFDQATLKPESEAALNQLLGALEGDTALSLTISGHTDSDGADAYNLDLSKRRAEAVKAWLVGKGVADGRLVAEGKGEAEPVASNDTADGRALNRRVEAAKR